MVVSSVNSSYDALSLFRSANASNIDLGKVDKENSNNPNTTSNEVLSGSDASFISQSVKGQGADVAGGNYNQVKSTEPAVLVSQEVNSVLLGEQEVGIQNKSESYNSFDSNKGSVDIDLDEYFSNNPPKSEYRLIDDLPPLLLPSAANINAISEHVAPRFEKMLKEYNIPSAPDNITYDNEGNMQLPDDYPYSDELTAALEANPGIDRELRTIHALTSHYVELQKLIPFQEEYSSATSQEQINAILNKYSHLFNSNGGNKDYSEISLEFTGDGSLSLKADGQDVSLA